MLTQSDIMYEPHKVFAEGHDRTPQCQEQGEGQTQGHCLLTLCSPRADNELTVYMSP